MCLLKSDFQRADGFPPTTYVFSSLPPARSPLICVLRVAGCIIAARATLLLCLYFDGGASLQHAWDGGSVTWFYAMLGISLMFSFSLIAPCEHLPLTPLADRIGVRVFEARLFLVSVRGRRLRLGSWGSWRTQTGLGSELPFFTACQGPLLDLDVRRIDKALR